MSIEQLSVMVAGTRTRADERVKRALSRQFALVEWPETPTAAEQLLPRCHFDCVVVEAASAQDPVLAWVDRLRREASPGQLIFVAGPPVADLAAAARLAGAHGCMSLPLDAAALREALNGRVPSAPLAAGRAGRAGAATMVELVGDSMAIRAVRSLVARIAPTPATVLVEGETGTGKELVARLLHQQSGRRGPFVPVNCGAIAPELMESELFGHAKGAFTGAHQLREGLFLAAHGGTLFLDEIGAMRHDLQVKLLRALEEGAIRPVGTDREVPVNARIIASVQPGLALRVADGQFREDLYYRLNVAHVVLPPLRQRPDDVIALAQHFMARAAAEFGMPAVALGPAEAAWLRSRPWPGNVRELRNLVERAVLAGELPGMAPPPAIAEPDAGDAYPLDWTLEQVKEAHMRRVLDAHRGNKSAAARRLGVSRKTLERKLGVDGDAGDE
ncbi:MAG: Fis family transcriptional regulator [Proteobacteria bacterium]|nr:Fis family transcriptional regulator [Pseudomonadota bacterium]